MMQTKRFVHYKMSIGSLEFVAILEQSKIQILEILLIFLSSQRYYLNNL